MELGEICRTCLRRGQPVWPLFDENQEFFTVGTPLADFINKFTQIMILRIEGFPEQICTPCLNDIKRIYAFKLRCEFSETALYHLNETNGILNLENFNYDLDIIKGTTEHSNDVDDLKTNEHLMDTNYEDANDTSCSIFDMMQIEMKDEDTPNLDLEVELNAAIEQQIHFKDRLEVIKSCANIKEEPEDTYDEEHGDVMACPACPTHFPSRDQLKAHLMDYHTDGKLCILCNEEYDYMRSHTEKHLLPRLQCSHCDLKFEYRPLLNTHLRTHMIKNENTGKLEFKCDQCTRSFSSHHDFTTHKRTHSGDRPFICDTCGMAFKRRDKLKAHMTSHSDERPFECTLCESRFKRKDNLASHLKSVHQQGDKIYKCDMCEKAFRFKDKLRAHFNTHLRLFSCEICHQGFPRKESLDRHIEHKHRTELVVTSQKPTTINIPEIVNYKITPSPPPPPPPEPKSFPCKFCNKEFRLEDSLNNHMKMHVKKVELKCELCSKVFSQSNKLKSHMITHTDVRPFQCSYCPSIFKRKDNLNRHMKKHSESKCK